MAVGDCGGCGPIRGWSGCGGGRAAGRGEEALPFVFAVPAFGQVQRRSGRVKTIRRELGELAAAGKAAGLVMALARCHAAARPG